MKPWSKNIYILSGLAAIGVLAIFNGRIGGLITVIIAVALMAKTIFGGKNGSDA